MEDQKTIIENLELENTELYIKNSQMKRAIQLMNKKINFYIKNSQVHPNEDGISDIITDLMSNTILQEKEEEFKLEKEEIILKYENKIKEINVNNNKGTNPINESEEINILKQKIDKAVENEKKSREKLVEAAKRMKKMKEEMNLQLKELEILRKK